MEHMTAVEGAQTVRRLADWYEGDQGYTAEAAYKAAVDELELIGWRDTGFMDARAGETRCSYNELLEANEEIGDQPTEEHWHAYMQGFERYELKAHDACRTLEEQQRHDAMGGDWIWRNDGA